MPQQARQWHLDQQVHEASNAGAESGPNDFDHELLQVQRRNTNTLHRQPPNAAFMPISDLYLSVPALPKGMRRAHLRAMHASTRVCSDVLVCFADISPELVPFLDGMRVGYCHRFFGRDSFYDIWFWISSVCHPAVHHLPHFRREDVNELRLLFIDELLKEHSDMNMEIALPGDRSPEPKRNKALSMLEKMAATEGAYHHRASSAVDRHGRPLPTAVMARARTHAPSPTPARFA